MEITKKGQFFLFPPPELTEYLILISPTEEIKKEIKKIKTKINKLTGNTAENTYAVPHISLFKTAWEKDSHLLEKLKKSLADISGFAVSINGVEVFSHGTKKKTLYLKVENPKPIIALYEACRPELKLKKDFTPHLTLEKNILTADFEKIQHDLAAFNHACNWNCEKITVFKFNKKTNTYKLVEEISLSAPIS